MNLVVALLVIVLIVAVAAAVWFFMQNRRTKELRAGFGPEYERAVRDAGGQSEAEKELTARQKRVEALQIQPLPPGERTRFAEAWRQTQARFVDDPSGAVGEADDLIGQVMQARGYPVGDFEQRAADVSVDHAEVVTNYRAAHRIAQAQGDTETRTEDLRQAMVHYRALFDDLLQPDPRERQQHDHQESREQVKEVRR